MMTSDLSPSLLRPVSELITELGLDLDDKSRCLVSFSGGPDSVFLVHVLKTLFPKIQLHLVYFDHQLRQHSYKDVNFVMSFSKDNNCKVTVRKIPVLYVSKKKKMTIEQSGRWLRRRYIRHMMSFHSFKYCFLGHHNDDKIETFMFRLLKGSKGGLTSIMPITKLAESCYLCRPLLPLFKSDIVGELSRLSIDFLVDETNLDTAFDRNKIRQNLDQLGLPINAEYKKHISSFIHFLQQSHDVLDQVSGLGTVKRHHNAFVASFNLTHISRDPFLVDWVISSLFRDIKSMRESDCFSYEQKHIEHVRDSFLSENTALFQLPSRCVGQVINHMFYIKYALPEKEYPVITSKLNLDDFGIELAFTPVSYPASSTMSSSKNAYISVPNKSSKIFVRTLRKGDIFQCFGKEKAEYLHKVMSKWKIPFILRDVIPLIFCDNQLAWVVGYHVSELFRVTSDSMHILHVKVEENL